MWVFAYGSLLWDPGFEPVEKIRAELSGFQRSFCMWSIHHRGTPEHRGLVLALDQADGTCEGVALKVNDREKAKVLAYLRERELISSAYLEQWLNVELRDGRVVDAVTYVINRDHEQYCQLDLERQAQIITHAVGGRGPNHEYLSKTVDLLHELKIPDDDLDWLQHRVTEIRNN